MYRKCVVAAKCDPIACHDGFIEYHVADVETCHLKHGRGPGDIDRCTDAFEGCNRVPKNGPRVESNHDGHSVSGPRNPETRLVQCKLSDRVLSVAPIGWNARRKPAVIIIKEHQSV